MTADAENRSAAVEQLKGMMTQESLETHMAEKHQGEPVPTLEQAHAMIEQTTEPKE